MAKTKTEATTAQKAATAASEAHKKAKEADKKNSTPATKATLEKTSEALTAARTIKNRESYVRVVNPRLAAVVTGLNKLAKLAAPRSYEYSDDDIAKMKTVIMDAAKNAITAFELSKTKTAKGTAAAPSFIS